MALTLGADTTRSLYRKLRWLQSVFIQRVHLALYVLSVIPCLFLGNTYFWDDWYTYFSGDVAQIRHLTIFSGFSPLRPYVESPLILLGPSAFRVFTVGAFLVVALLFSRILRRYSFLSLSQSESKVVSALMLLIPANGARWSLTTIGYTISLVTFIVAWYLLSKRTSIHAFLAIALFIYSFDTASLGIFAMAPVAAEVIERRNNRSLTTLWAPAAVFFSAPAYFAWDYFYNPNLDPVRQSYYTPTPGGLVRGLIVVVICGIACLRAWLKCHDAIQRNRIVAGCVLLCLATFPYVALGHFANPTDWLIGFLPGTSDWDSRHQLLIPTALSVLGIAVLKNLTISKPGVRLLLTGFFVLSFATNFNYLVDSIKLRSIQTGLADIQISSGSKVFVKDDSEHLNARGRWFRDFEWAGLIYKATGSEVRVTEVESGTCTTRDVSGVLLEITGGRGKLGTLLHRSAGIKITVTPNCGAVGVTTSMIGENLFLESVSRNSE